MGAVVRQFLGGILILFQLMTPALCHEHEVEGACPRRPHLHLSRFLFWLDDHDHADHAADHDADAVYVANDPFLATKPSLVGDPLSSFMMGSLPGALEPMPPLDVPDPVALPPPVVGSAYSHCPLYLAILSLRC
ncbi:MAG: hypothetical protein ACK4RK_20835 [Gemmataceae bacterium]